MEIARNTTRATARAILKSTDSGILRSLMMHATNKATSLRTRWATTRAPEATRDRMSKQYDNWMGIAEAARAALKAQANPIPKGTRYHFDGHGINDAKGERMATVRGATWQEREPLGHLIAESAEMRDVLRDLIPNMQGTTAAAMPAYKQAVALLERLAKVGV
jgi:hypothetical protein